ncbi:MAG: Crp/Fnr family transcriptional regulator [Bacteroidetes bacterium]|nr:Crp/Fnr family transcriptional regulator [Bacteroidota bacterium]
MLSYISSLIALSPELESEIKRISKEITVPKNHILTKTGERSHNLFFVESGTLRGYYFQEEKEITNWFAQEGEFATCFYAFIGGHPSFESIQAIEQTVLTVISFEALKTLYRNFPETERIGRVITEAYYMKLEERLLNIRFKTAKERYHNLIESRPALMQSASLGQIAAYLGITQETLSRIRAEL